MTVTSTSDATPADPAGIGASLDFDEVTVRYGSHVAVDRVSLRVAPRTVVAVTGSNGSGKSSLVRSALGLVPTANGRALVDGGAATTAKAWRERRRVVAYIPQRPAPGSFPLLVQELLRSSGDAARAADAAQRLGLGMLLERPLSALSGGQLQRAYIARAIGAIGAGARVLVADEPTSALDFEGQAQVAALLGALPVTVLVVTHSAALARVADRVVEMAGGRLREVER